MQFVGIEQMAQGATLILCFGILEEIVLPPYSDLSELSWKG